LDAKSFLRQYIYASKEIDRKLEEIARLRELVTRINVASDNTRVQVSPHDHVGDAIAKIVDMENEIDAQIDQLRTVKVKIEAALEAIDDKRLRLLLRYRYIDGLPFTVIGEKMSYSHRHIFRMFNFALQKIEDGTPWHKIT
jgi:DNA-directed RNA polymerase specialized sigma subunit